MLALYLGLVAYVIFAAVAVSLAWIRGGATERSVAAAFIIAAAASMVISAFGTHWRGPNWGVIVIDAAFLVALVVLACRSTRYWPIWAAASQLSGFLAHMPAIFLPSMPMKLYVATQPLWAFPLLLSLAIGSWRTARRRRSP
jgi:hypothetical protein